jgi:hypothetical protein
MGFYLSNEEVHFYMAKKMPYFGGFMEHAFLNKLVAQKSIC